MEISKQTRGYKKQNVIDYMQHFQDDISSCTIKEAVSLSV